MSGSVLLSTLTTLRLGGPAPRLLEGDSEDAIAAALHDADLAGEPVLLIAGGSNLVIADAGVSGPVLRIATRGVRAERDGDDLLVDVAAGEPWDPVVERFVDEGWSGLATLSGIPGSCGATPVQNVGAYGAEISDVLVDVTVHDRRTGHRRVVPAAELRLGYRSSVLRGSSDAVVLRVRFRLTRAATAVRYGELATTLGVPGGGEAPPAAVREAVLGLRRGKGMVIDPADPDTRSVGSFFTNPLLDDAALADADRRIRARLGAGPDGDVRYPRYPAAPHTKLSAAWLIEHAGFGKGFALARGGAAISAKHTLALTSRGGSTDDLIALARHVRDGVHDAFGIHLEAEPILVGVRL